MKQQREVIKATEAARRLGCSANCMYTILGKGEIPCWRLHKKNGAPYLLYADDLEAYRQKCMIVPIEPETSRRGSGIDGPIWRPGMKLRDTIAKRETGVK